MKWQVFAACTAVFLATAVVRFLALNGFSNDHYQYLAGAQQMLMGEWPTRDFLDPGQPLMYGLSAGAQLLFGRTLFAEAMLISIAFGLAAMCVVIAGWRLSQSLGIGILASVVSVVAFPLPYGYPKALLYAVVPLAIWAWVRSPSPRRLIAPAILVAVAFLIRHDHGVYFGVAASAAMVLTPPLDRRTRVNRLLMFGGLVLVALLPYLLFIQSQQGLWQYIAASMRFASREADRTQLHLQMIEAGSQTWLFYGVHALAIIAAVVVGLGYRRGESDVPLAAPIVVSALLVNFNFLRDPLATRLPDVMVPAVLTAAWLTGRAIRLRSLPLRSIAAAVMVVIWAGGAVNVASVGRAREQLNRTDLWRGIGAMPGVVREQTDQLKARYARQQLPDGRLVPLFPFFDYLDRCTTERHRLLVTGNAPEIYVYARRPFAAGHGTFVEGYSQSDAERQHVLSEVQQQIVAFTIVLSDQFDAWQRGFPELDAFVQKRFRPLTEIPVDEERTIRVLVHAGLPPSRVDASTGWPCFTL